MEILGVIIAFVVGLAAGGFAAWKFAREKSGVSEEEYQEVERERVRLSERVHNLESVNEDISQKLEEKEKEVNQLNSQLATAKESQKNMVERLEEQKGELEELQEKFTKEFENIAHKILKKNTKEFEEHSKKNLNELLDPMKEKLKDFQEKIEKTDKENQERNSRLVQQIKDLKDLNNQMHEDAQNLTKALKGESKTQGDWGEVVLQRILEKSGLQEGREYVVQESFKSEEGKRLQPDVVVRLPDNKNIVIDSKVSLTAYERYCSAETEEEREKVLKEHVRSFRQHIKDLSQRNYQDLYELQSLDFVLMFVPIEPAFGLAVQNSERLFSEAFEKNIVIVSTSTLLATLRTISSIWRQKKQTENALEIARQGGNLYDKFVGFVEDLEAIGRHIGRTQNAYEDAMNKLSTGRGNLVRRTEKLRKLGAKTSKQMPEEAERRQKLDEDTQQSQQKEGKSSSEGQEEETSEEEEEGEDEPMGKLFNE